MILHALVPSIKPPLKAHTMAMIMLDSHLFLYGSALSPQGGSDSESSDSEDDLEPPGPQTSDIQFQSASSPQGSPAKQAARPAAPAVAADSKMDVDPADGMCSVSTLCHLFKDV